MGGGTLKSAEPSAEAHVNTSKGAAALQAGRSTLDRDGMKTASQPDGMVDGDRRPAEIQRKDKMIVEARPLVSWKKAAKRRIAVSMAASEVAMALAGRARPTGDLSRKYDSSGGGVILLALLEGTALPFLPH